MLHSQVGKILGNVGYTNSDSGCRYLFCDEVFCEANLGRKCLNESFESVFG